MSFVTMRVTCLKCRAWYDMDMEPHLSDEHFNFRTGQPCTAGDEDWHIIPVNWNEDYQWKYVH